MNYGIKIALYIFLIALASLFGSLAYVNYDRLMQVTPDDAELDDVPLAAANLDKKATSSYSNVILFGAGFFFSLLGLGLLAGHDVSNFFGDRALKMLYNDEGEGVACPQYEKAEEEWANGNHLEAVRLMREYLNQNPREQHVSIRIAEIYEKDLANPLAAALEYEEVLKHKLPEERWGWAAIHLCNLYFKLNQEQKAIDLLRRIDSEYGETAAADKARKRLLQIDGPPPEEIETPPEPPKHQLPPGFAPRKLK